MKSLYHRFVSRDIVIVVIFSSCIAIIAIIIAVLVGANVLTGAIAIISFFSLAVVTCLSGLIFITLLNSESQVLPSLVLPNEMEFSNEEQDFLQTLIDLPVDKDVQEVESPLLDERVDERVSIRVSYYSHIDYKYDVRARVAALETVLEEHIRAIIAALLHDPGYDSDITKRILKEIRDLFIPKFTSTSNPETTLCYHLNRWGELLQQYSCADFLILVLDNPRISCLIVEQLISLSSRRTSQDDDSYLESILCSFNLWMSGFFLSENYEKIVRDYNPSLLTEEVCSCIEEGNFVRLICNQLPTELLNKFISILPVSIESLSVRENSIRMSPGINSEDYVNNSPSLRVIIDELNLHMAFCLNLPSVSSWSFKFALAKNLSSIWDLRAFIKENRRVLMNNFFLLVEFLYSHKKYQSFIRQILSKAMPMPSWKTIFQHMIAGLFNSGIVGKRELEVMANHLGMSLLDLKEIISLNRFLEELLPNLFSDQ
ncbi:hypothetical protein BOKEGFJH_00295 [Chlamydia avium]|nr:hypothetical protein BOKEGFJH_00295 [Chlamydia avium]